MQTLLRIALLLAGAYVLACIALFFMQRSLLYYPQPRRYGSDESIMKLTRPDAQLVVSTRAAPDADAVI